MVRDQLRDPGVEGFAVIEASRLRAVEFREAISDDRLPLACVTLRLPRPEPAGNRAVAPPRQRATTCSRDEAIRAAMRDAAVLAGILEGEFQATYRGPERSEYVRVLTEIVAGLGGSLEAGAIGLAATFADRQIKIRFASG